MHPCTGGNPAVSVLPPSPAPGPGGRCPGRRFGTCGGRALSAHRRGAACGGRKRVSSRWPDLAPGWDPPARRVPAKGRLCQDAALLPAAPLPASREEGKAMVAGQDWLSPLPRAGGQRWGCPGCSRPRGAVVVPPERVDGGAISGVASRAGVAPISWLASHGSAPRVSRVLPAWRVPSLPGCDGAKRLEQPRSPSPSGWRAQLCWEHWPGCSHWCWVGKKGFGPSSIS